MMTLFKKFRYFLIPKHLDLRAIERSKSMLFILILILTHLFTLFSLEINYVRENSNITAVYAVASLLLIATTIYFIKSRNRENASLYLSIILSGSIMATLFCQAAFQELSLFYFALIPLVLFFLVDLTMALILSAVNALILFLFWMLAVFEWHYMAFDAKLMFLLLLSYVSASLLVLFFEKVRRDFEVTLKKSIASRELLLKEVHHRTKNNMQVMMSLLWMQSRNVDEANRHYFKHAMDRLSAMSLVHEALYKNENIDEVDMQIYLNLLVKNFKKMSHHTIHLEVDAIHFSMMYAMNIGLMVNEAVTNSVQHAFEDENGDIYISLQREDNGYLIQLRDSGSCDDTIYDVGTSKHLGVTLIKDLAANLVEGHLKISTMKGLSLTITFKGES